MAGFGFPSSTFAFLHIVQFVYISPHCRHLLMVHELNLFSSHLPCKRLFRSAMD